jgi:hypothetical protein
MDTFYTDSDLIRRAYEHHLVSAKPLQVAPDKFGEIVRNVWADNNKPINSFFYQGHEFVAFSNYAGEFVQAHIIEDLSVYKGVLKPITNGAFYHEVDTGKRERGWCDGLLAQMGTRKIVFCQRYLFSKSQEQSNVQLSLF